MEKKPVTYDIEGTTFTVDVANNELREVGNPANRISFREMDYMKTHYEFLYHLGDKNIPSGLIIAPAEVTEVRVPQLVELDPAGMSAHYKVPLAEIPDKTDFDLVVDQHLVGLRERGVLPNIVIGIDNYFIDLRLHELRAAGDFNSTIDLRKLGLSQDGEYFGFFYDTTKKQLYNVSKNLFSLPPGVIGVEIPNELGLDPVGFSRMHNMDPTRFLMKYPPQELKAVTVPVSETALPELVKENRLKYKNGDNPNPDHPYKKSL